MVRFIFHFGTYFCLLQLFLPPITAQDNTQTAKQVPKPAINISFSKQVIRENDCIPVEVRFLDESEQEITKAVLDITLPAFIKKSDKPCDAEDDFAPTATVTSTELVPSGEEKSLRNIRSGKIYLKTGADINIGDYNLLFTVNYWWKANNQNKQSFVSTEKTLKINFLGSDTIAGIPLGLAGLIVPGLFFFFTIRILGVNSGIETPLGDKLIYAVLISFAIIASASLLKPYALTELLRHLDISSGIGINKLMWLAGSGILVGAAFSIGSFARRKWSEKKEKEATIYFNDEDNTIIEKLLRKDSKYNPSLWSWIWKHLNRKSFRYKPQTRVKLEDERIFVGSLGEKGKDITVLAGWVRIDISTSHPKLEKLKKLEKKGLLYKLFVKARNDENIEINLEHSVQEQIEKVDPSTYKRAVTWSSSKIVQAAPEEGTGVAEVVVIKER